MASDRFGDEYDDDRPRRRPAGDAALGREKVRGPGLLLVLYGLFTLLLSGASVALMVASPDTLAKPYHDMLANMMKDLPKQPGQPDPVPPYDEFKQQMVVQTAIGGVLGLVAGAVITLGGVKMRSASSKGLSLTSAILAMIPVGGCCLVGLPIGIWAIVTLGKPEVKAAFAQSARPRDLPDDLDDR
jgi:hypothetical protein